jgi:predicted RNA-binding Zn-ribbon protein involved in translation (DUF1610 family)
MTHVVTLRADPADPGVVYLCTAPGMSSTMGGFGPARYVGNTPPVPGASYVISRDDLPRFTVYCANRQVSIVDSRTAPSAHRPYGREAPLPECLHCGQPVRRGTHWEHCPNCGMPWQVIEVGAPYSQPNRNVTDCQQCGRSTLVGFAHCTHCGELHG